MPLPDWIFRVAYYYGYRAARIVWKFTKPHHLGAVVALWYNEQVLLVRTSYRGTWDLPGGGVETHEIPAQAAIREISEELGFKILPEQIHLALIVDHFWENRHDKVHIFETHLSNVPTIKIDKREIVETRFFSAVEAMALTLQADLRNYFRTKAQI